MLKEITNSVLAKPEPVTSRQEQLIAVLTRGVFKLHGQLLEEGERTTADCSLTPARHRILGCLVRAKGGMTVPQIAREMGLARQSIQRLADVLVGDGHAAYRDNPAHSKSRLLCLTDAGDAAYSALAEPRRLSIATMARGLSPQAMENAIALLEAIGENLDRAHPQ